MKKLISGLLIGAMLSASTVFSVGAVDNDTLPVNIKVLDTISIPNNVARLYTYNLTAENTETGMSYTSTVDNSSKRMLAKNSIGQYQEAEMSSTAYNYLIILGSSSGGNIDNFVDFSKTGGQYQKIRIKLSDLVEDFNDDGTFTYNLFNEPHNFNFTSDDKVGNYEYSSGLIILSGAVATAVAPDKDGYIEFYQCKNIGVSTKYMTEFSCDYITASGSHDSTSGGGCSGATITGLTFGDIDLNGYVSVSDVTEIQKYIVGLTDSSSEFTEMYADVNFDGVVDINDATLIQKYLVGII
ncbi:MAG: dockerin type I repeat-containing protein [Ruminococcus sp.]|nr:dockerin type I repeat-containing protein [Ruminococcus sp.]